MTTGEPGAPSWQQALDELERSLQDASRSIALLRRSLEAAALEAERPAAPQPPAPSEDNGRSAFERVWERIEHERLERAESAPEPSTAARGLDLLPQQYLVTVEDRERTVDLVLLHRALLGVVRMEDFSLVSFANGVPVISLRVKGELDADRLSEAVSVAMEQDCEVLPQDNGRVFLRLTSRQDQGG